MSKIDLKHIFNKFNKEDKKSQPATGPGSTDEQQKYALIGSLIILVIIIGIATASFKFGINKGSKNTTKIPIINISKPKDELTAKVLGASIRSWSGKIVKLNNSEVVFESLSKTKDGKIKNKKYIAIVGPNTKLQSWDLTKPPMPDNPRERYSKKNISFKQFSINQQILVKSSKEANDKNEIDADSISLLITPTN